MRNYFTFGNIDSRDYGVYISGSGIWNAPGREYNIVSVPGRNGDLLIDGNRFSNIEVTYPAFIHRGTSWNDFGYKLKQLRSVLLSTEGYARLADSYRPSEFRLACFMSEIVVKPTEQLDAGEFDLTFYCKPQKFFTSGEEVETVNSTQTISFVNDTGFTAKPLIKVYGYGTLEWRGVNITVDSNNYTSITIDSERMECYTDYGSANEIVHFPSYSFPVLAPGANVVTVGNTFSKIEVTPRWWSL